MRPIVLLLAVACLVAGCGAGEASPREALPDAADGCPQVQVVGVRGQSQSLEHHRGLGTEVDAIVRELQKQLKADGVDEVDVDAVQHRSRNASDLAIYDADVEQGRTLLTERLSESVEDCPDARIVVVGFSQGAQIAQEAIAAHPRLAQKVAALALVGSPRHDPDSPITHLDLPGAAATHAGSLGAGPDLGNLAARTVDACLTGDVVCDADGGTDYTTHKHGYEDAGITRQVGSALHRTLLG